MERESEKLTKLAKFHQRDVIEFVLAWLEPAEQANIQSVCHHWYELRIPRVMKISIWQMDNERRVEAVLGSEPVDAGPAIQAMWSLTKPMCNQIFRHFARVLNLNFDLFDKENAKFESWMADSAYSGGVKSNAIGMRHKKTGKVTEKDDLLDMNS